MEDGEDAFDEENAWLGDIDIEPKVFVENMPNIDDGAFLVEYFDPVPDLERDWKNEQEAR